MTLDGLTLYSVVDELKEKIVNSKIQKVLMPTKEEIILSLYSATCGTVKLCLNADAGDCATYITTIARKNPKVAPAFCMFLRKYLTGAIITDISQSGLNRVVTFSLSAKDELLRSVELYLIIEIMGKYSNIILTNSDKKILDSIHRVSIDMSSKRQILPGMFYSDPPQEKLNPKTLSLTSLTEALTTKKDTRMTYHMTSVFDGISTQTATEILSRATITSDSTTELNDNQISRIAHTLSDFLNETVENKTPCIQQNSDGLPVFFSSAKFVTYPEELRTYFDSCNEMLDYYYSRRAEIFRLLQQKDSLSKNVSKLLTKLEKRINIYQNSIEDAKRSAKVQRRADLITANLYQLKKGMKEFTTIDYETGKEVTIALDLSMTPQMLTQKLYKKIAKYKRAAALNEVQLAEAQDEQDFLLGTLHFIELAQSTAEIAEIKQSLHVAGYIASPQKNKKSDLPIDSTPITKTSPTGYTIYIGKNDRQNDILTNKTARKDDIWFHTQKIPGSHVILVTNGKDLNDIDDETIVYAAQLAAAHSRAKQSGKTPVDYTQRKNIKKPPNARPGKVIYDDYFTVYVDANDS